MGNVNLEKRLRWDETGPVGNSLATRFPVRDDSRLGIEHTSRAR